LLHIKDLDYQEKREIWKILYDITDQLRPFLLDLQQAYHFLGEMDLLHAKSKVASSFNGVRPQVNVEQTFKWEEAYHPLLYLKNQELKKETVPLNISLNDEERILLISGPNAGGKSVCLKTVVLNQYMIQCGLLVPMDPSSSCQVFDKIFIDIGDEQSIENDLSTYSSHLKNMNYFMKEADDKTLILIDEFGSGTDPQFGASIAEAILEELNQSGNGCFGVITTHYSNLKKYAEEQNGLVNGAMLYDIKKLKPLYQLEMGRPGSSFAFEIAHDLGLKEEIIAKAKERIGFSQIKYDQLLSDLEEQNRQAKKRSEHLKSQEKKLRKALEEYENLKQYLEKEKERILGKSKLEAQQLLDNSRKEIEKTIRIIKEEQAEKEATKRARQSLDDYAERNITKSKRPAKQSVQHKQEKKSFSPQISIGDVVKVKNSGAKGEVLAIEKNEVEILVGSLKSRVKPNRLEKIGETKDKPGKNFYAPKKTSDLNISVEKSMFSPELDIRGKKPEEVLPVFEKYMDKAHLLGLDKVRVIHGKGYGVLKQLVREYLKKLPYVGKVEDEAIEQGGAGVSVVELK
jgi:DNA mismatch repair protein MutS2